MINTYKTTQKIISLAPNLTETLVDLHLEENIVGISESCTSPNHLQFIKSIVTSKEDINMNVIKDLKADVLYYDSKQISKDYLHLLNKFIKCIPIKINTINDNFKLIEELGIKFNRRVESQNLQLKLQTKINEFKSEIVNNNKQKIAYFVTQNPWTVRGENKYINEIFDLCNFENIYKNIPDLTAVNIQRIRFEGDPEIILLNNEFNLFSDEHAFELSEYTNRSTTIFVTDRVFNSYGSGFVNSLNYFKTIKERILNSGSFYK